MSVHVTIDRTLCEGHGLCMSQDPDLFGPAADDEARAVVVFPEGQVPSGKAQAARDAARVCPSGAITVGR